MGDASAPVVHVLLRTATGLVPQAPLRLAEPNGTANLVADDDLNDDSRQDVVVADRASKSLVVFDNRGASQFAPPRTIAAGIDAVSLLVGDFGGDWQHRDVAVADALRNTVVRYLTPGDPLVVAGADAHNPSADGGLLAWSYVAPAGVAAVAVWDRTLAYEVGNAPNRTCPGNGGIWLRGPRGRPIRRGSGRLGDFRDGFAAWMAHWSAGNGNQIRVAARHGRIRTLARIGIDCRCGLEHPTITHGHLVYGINNDGESPGGVDVYRVRLRDRGACQEAFANPTRMAIPVLFSVEYTVDGNAIFYADSPPSGRAFGTRGIFQVDPARVHWRRDCSLTRW